MAKKIQNTIVKPLAAIYARYSSHKQNEVSIEQQVAECQEYAERSGIEVVAIYSDRALTGKTDKRPEFQKMIRHAEKGQFDLIIAWKSSRLARNMLNALIYEEKFKAYGIQVLYCKEEFGDTAAGRFALRNMMNVNQFHSENLSEDVKRSMYEKAELCQINGPLPFGFRKGADKKYEIDPSGAAIVKEIFKRVDNEESFVDIYTDLNNRGIKTSRKNDWNKHSFRALLRNERYTGVYIFGDIRVDGGVPEIIEKELFLKVQERIDNKENKKGRHRANGDYILTGKLFCGKCGSLMTGLSGTSSTGNLYFYYGCQKKRNEKGCDKTAIRREWIEHEIAAGIQDYLMQDDILHKMADLIIDYGKQYKQNSNISLYEKQLKDTQKAIKNIMAAIEQGIFTESTKARLEELEAEQKSISARLLMERSEIFEVSKEDILLWLSSLRSGNVDDQKYRKKLFDSFVISAYVYDDHYRIVFNHTGKKQKLDVTFKFIDGIDKENAAEFSYEFVCRDAKEGEKLKTTQTSDDRSSELKLVTHPRLERGTP